DLAVLADDKHYFPPYEAVPVLGRAVMQQHPEVAAAIAQLEGKISDDDMRKMNYAVDGQHEDPSVVVKQFLAARGLE
ncbi:MAG: glycine betaine ABC transporter substrate-binding protein, partial [Candidatus Acidiferrales bacterium]